MVVRELSTERGVGRWAIWWPLALIALLPALTWWVVSDEPWKRSEKIAAVGIAVSIAAAVAIYIGSRLGERRAETLAGSVRSHRADAALRGGRDVLAGSLRRERVWFNLPLVVAAFAGREQELDELGKALDIADGAVIMQAISGLGGVGKSQLAARYVQQHTDDYDVVAWIRAEDGGIADLAQLAARLGLPVDELSPHDRAQLARGWLSESEQRWLLVLDNIQSAEQLEALLPRRGEGRVLVTSRDRSLRQFGPVLSLDVFNEDTATAYLTERATRLGDERAARELARALGCLPLALSHAAAYCQSGTSFPEYQDLLGALPARDLFDSNPELFYAQTIASTWKASIQAASAAAPLATEVLKMAAYLGPDAIPRVLFATLVDADTARGRKRLADAFNALARFSLATVDDGTVSMHRLLQKVVRDDGAVREDRTAAVSALAAMTAAFPSDPEPPTCWPLCEHLLPHALALADSLPQAGAHGSEVVDLLHRTCWYLSCAEPGRRGLGVAQRSLAHAERVLGSEHPRTLGIRQALAIAHCAAGHLGDAIAIYEPLITDSKRVLGPEHERGRRRRLR
jgi:NB-ARC domain